jgi:hypothetical protein
MAAPPTPIGALPIRRLADWKVLADTAKAKKFQNTARLHVEIERMKPYTPDLEPWITTDDAQGLYLIARGTLLGPGPMGQPPLIFRVSFAPEFPQRHPIITVERPPAESSWTLCNTPTIDASGTCYLQNLSQWNPPQSSVVNCMAELQGSVQQHPPFQLKPTPQASTAYPPQPAPYPPQPAQPAPPSCDHHPLMPQQTGVHSPLAQPQQVPGLRPPAQNAAPPPAVQARGMDEVWAMITTMVFAKAEAELSSGRVTFGPADRERLLSQWSRSILTDALNRRRGASDGIMLASGTLLTADRLQSPTHRHIFELLLRAQSTGDPSYVDEAWFSIRDDPEWKVKLRNTEELLVAMFGGGGRTTVTVEDVWKGFFSRAFAVGEQALADGDILPNELIDREPFLYLGLTALTAFDFVKRSPPHGPMRLALGESDLTHENCPPEGQQLLGAFLQLRDGFYGARVSPQEERQLRRAILLSGHERPGAYPQLRPELSRLVSGFQSIAVHGSQQEIFKRHFDAVIELLASIAYAR